MVKYNDIQTKINNSEPEIKHAMKMDIELKIKEENESSWLSREHDYHKNIEDDNIGNKEESVESENIYQQLVTCESNDKQEVNNETNLIHDEVMQLNIEHHNSETKDKENVCAICNKEFLTKWIWKQHMTLHSRTKGRTIKYCFVPDCPNTSANNPRKIYITVPQGETRANWFQAVWPGEAVRTSGNLYACEDHFDLPNDAENWQFYKTIGTKLRMKKDIVPKIRTTPVYHMTDSEKKRRQENIEMFKTSRRKFEYESQPSTSTFINITPTISRSSSTKVEPPIFNSFDLKQNIRHDNITELQETSEKRDNKQMKINNGTPLIEQETNLNIKQEIEQYFIKEEPIEESKDIELVIIKEENQDTRLSYEE